MSFATKSDLATFLFIEEADLPDSSDRNLMLAEDQIKSLILDNYDLSNEDHLEALKKATCAQSEFLIENPQAATGREIQSFSSGRTSATFKDENITYRGFSNMTIMYLNQQGLLYRGIKMRGSVDEC